MAEDGQLKAALLHPAQSQRVMRRDGCRIEPQRASSRFFRSVALADTQLRDREISPRAACGRGRPLHMTVTPMRLISYVFAMATDLADRVDSTPMALAIRP